MKCDIAKPRSGIKPICLNCAETTSLIMGCKNQKIVAVIEPVPS
jgi:hypothetical protein